MTRTTDIHPEAREYFRRTAQNGDASQRVNNAVLVWSRFAEALTKGAMARLELSEATNDQQWTFAAGLGAAVGGIAMWLLESPPGSLIVAGVMVMVYAIVTTRNRLLEAVADLEKATQRIEETNADVKALDAVIDVKP